MLGGGSYPLPSIARGLPSSVLGSSGTASSSILMSSSKS
jgi:hypothetical protein